MGPEFKEKAQTAEGETSSRPKTAIVEKLRKAIYDRVRSNQSSCCNCNERIAKLEEQLNVYKEKATKFQLYAYKLKEHVVTIKRPTIAHKSTEIGSTDLKTRNSAPLTNKATTALPTPAHPRASVVSQVSITAAGPSKSQTTPSSHYIAGLDVQKGVQHANSRLIGPTPNGLMTNSQILKQLSTPAVVPLKLITPASLGTSRVNAASVRQPSKLVVSSPTIKPPGPPINSHLSNGINVVRQNGPLAAASRAAKKRPQSVDDEIVCLDDQPNNPSSSNGIQIQPPPLKKAPQSLAINGHRMPLAHSSPKKSNLVPNGVAPVRRLSNTHPIPFPPIPNPNSAMITFNTNRLNSGGTKLSWSVDTAFTNPVAKYELWFYKVTGPFQWQKAQQFDSSTGQRALCCEVNPQEGQKPRELFYFAVRCVDSEGRPSNFSQPKEVIVG